MHLAIVWMELAAFNYTVQQMWAVHTVWGITTMAVPNRMPSG